MVVLPMLDGALARLVLHPGRPIFFHGAAKRIIDGNADVAIILCRELPVVQCFGHVDALVAGILEDGATYHISND